MSEEEFEAIQRALARERQRRQTAETQLEEKARELFHSFEELDSAHQQLKENQRQLIQSEKMASLGVMSAGVAHEINNPIGFVQSNLNSLSEYVGSFSTLFEETQTLLGALEGSEQHKDAIDKLTNFIEEEDLAFLAEDTADLVKESQEGLARVAKIVAGLKEFARVEEIESDDVDLNQEIEKTLTITNGQLKNTCSVSTSLGELPEIRGNASQLSQVLTNLIVNASQAVDADGGEVSIRSYLENNQVHVEVRDNGCGMSPETQEKLFTPFFTTKAVGEGTGLGLSISYGIVEEHGGKIDVQSIEGEGSTFTIRLPAA